jgi:hypothetical protein
MYNFTEPEFAKTFQCIKINDRLSKGREIHCEVGKYSSPELVRSAKIRGASSGSEPLPSWSSR